MKRTPPGPNAVGLLGRSSPAERTGWIRSPTEQRQGFGGQHDGGTPREGESEDQQVPGVRRVARPDPQPPFLARCVRGSRLSPSPTHPLIVKRLTKRPAGGCVHRTHPGVIVTCLLRKADAELDGPFGVLVDLTVCLDTLLARHNRRHDTFCTE